MSAVLPGRYAPAAWLIVALCGFAAGCGGSTGGKVVPRTPTAAEIEEADRTSRSAEEAEHEAFDTPAPAKKKP